MKTVKWWVFTVSALLGLAQLSAWAGDLTPPGPPGPTMNTLAELYQKLTNTLAEAQAANQKLTNTLAEVQATKQQVLSNQQRLAYLERLVTAGSLHPSSGDMVLIPAGSFLMGACTNVGQEAISDAIPQHTVYVSAFYMDKYLVTSNLWGEVYTWAMSKGYAFANAGEGKGSTYPVVNVNWYDAIAWCNARSQRDGFTPCYTNANGTVYNNSSGNSFDGGCNWAVNGYRLPTEAEWEKAARGGVANRRFPWDDANTIQHARANYSAAPALYSYDTSPTTGAHPSYDTGGRAFSPVGSFAPNMYGLYDMAGNVRQWCWDIYSSTYFSVSPGTDPRGPDGDSGSRVMRGGAYMDKAEYVRCAFRMPNVPHGSYPLPVLGFRCARGL